MSEPRPAIKRLRERKERHQQRGRPYRVVFALVGVIVILAGLVLSLPGVPGPGLLLVAVGLGMLALEFDRAERLLERVLDRVDRAADRLSPLQKSVVAVLSVAALVGAFVAVLLFEIPVLPG
jgi:uncharacterized protein (TIGR02611 family)